MLALGIRQSYPVVFINFHMNASRFRITNTPLAGPKIIQRKLIEDARGFLCRFFCAEELAHIGFHKPITQINHTLTHKVGVVRGLHFQYSPAAEAKIISCIKGEVYDVAVDIRQGSPTFLQWHAELLSADNFKSYFLPEGFAHGVQALTANCEMLYLHSESFKPETVGALNVLDPKIAIKWPLEITELSERDRQHPFVSDEFKGVVL